MADNETGGAAKIAGQISGAFINVDGVIDIQRTAINGGSANITLLPNEIPVMGEVSNEAV